MKKALLYLSVLCSLSILLTGCSSEGTDNAQLEADISPVIPKINSTVLSVRVADNQQVKRGDSLIVLDTATFAIAVSQAEISLLQALRNVNLATNNKASASVNVSSVTATSNAFSGTLASAKAEVESARVRLQVADKNAGRYTQLLAERSTTQQQSDQVNSDKVEASSKLQSALARLNALVKQIESSKMQITNTRTQVASSSEGISLAELAVRQAQMNLKAARLQLSYCTILAPADGVVSKKNVQVGQVVGIGEPLMAIVNNKLIWVVANFKETQIEKMKIGQAAEVSVDAYGSKTFNGKVESFAQATGAKFSLLPSDNATGNFVKVTQRIPVKIMMTENNSEYPLRAGMSVSVKVKLN